MNNGFGKGIFDGVSRFIDHLIPALNGVLNLGSDKSKFGSLWLAGDANVDGDVVVTGSITSTEGAVQSVATGVSAAGTVIGDATALTAQHNVVGTVASGAGAQLASGTPVGGSQVVQNRGANALLVYPHSASGTHNGGSAGAAVSVDTDEVATFTRVSATDWSVGIKVAP